MGEEEAEVKEEPPEEAQWAEGKSIRRRGEESEGKMAGISKGGGGTSAESALWWHDNALNVSGKAENWPRANICWFRGQAGLGWPWGPLAI